MRFSVISNRVNKFFHFIWFLILLNFLFFSNHAAAKTIIYSGNYSGDDHGEWGLRLEAEDYGYFFMWSEDNRRGSMTTVYFKAGSDFTGIIGGVCAVAGKIDAAGKVSGQWSCQALNKKGIFSGKLNSSERIKDYAGYYAGTYTGADTGTWNLELGLDGKGKGIFYSSNYNQKYDLMGIATEDGTIFGYTTSETAFYAKIITPTHVDGEWSNMYYELYGVLSGDKKGQPISEVYGKVTSEDGTPLCAMILANGKYTFSSMNDGAYSFGTSTDQNGLITLFAFADGFAPFKQILSVDEAKDFHVILKKAPPGVPELFVKATVTPITQTPEKAIVSGKVTTFSGSPVCAMILANGRYMFSNAKDGSFSLEVSLTQDGLITLFAFADGFAPFKRNLMISADLGPVPN